MHAVPFPLNNHTCLCQPASKLWPDVRSWCLSAGAQRWAGVSAAVTLGTTYPVSPSVCAVWDLRTFQDSQGFTGWELSATFGVYRFNNSCE